LAVCVLNEDDCKKEGRCKERIVRPCAISFLFENKNIWGIDVGDSLNVGEEMANSLLSDP